MDIIEENELSILKEDILGDLEWQKVSRVNLGSCKKPNLNIKQIKIQPIRRWRI